MKWMCSADDADVDADADVDVDVYVDVDVDVDVDAMRAQAMGHDKCSRDERLDKNLHWERGCCDQLHATMVHCP